DRRLHYRPKDLRGFRGPLAESFGGRCRPLEFNAKIRGVEHARLLDWNNASLIKGDLGEAVRSIKKKHSRDMAVFGSAELGGSLAELGLVDEFRFFVTPYLLGRGTMSFDRIRSQVDAKLVSAEAWPSGTVALTYRVN